MSSLRKRVPGHVQITSEDVQLVVQRVWFRGAWRRPEQIEIIRQRDKERYRERWKTDESFRSKESLRSKSRRAMAPEQERERARIYHSKNRDKRNEKRKQWARDNRERQRESFRKSYHTRREEYLKSETARRDRRDPSRVVRRLTKDLKEGRIDLDTFTAQVRQQFDVIDGRIRELDRSSKVTGRIAKSRSTSSGISIEMRDSHCHHNTDSSKPS